MSDGQFDVLIVGAGAAGLAAAAALSRSGRRVCLLEARDRIGGRIFTRHEPDVALPLELGAEFVHGELPATLAWLRAGGTTVSDAAPEQWQLRDGRLVRSGELFDALRRRLANVERPREDVSVESFLAGAACASWPADVAAFARMLVDGYDAADPSRASALEMIEEWGRESEAPNFRPLDGYGSLLRALSGALDPGCVRLQLSTRVHTLRWQRGAVEIEAVQHGRTISVAAPQAVLTLPLGVLRQPPDAPGAVRFVPELNEKRQVIETLGAGQVVKLLMRFREPFWETHDDGGYRDAAFLHTPAAAFPTFWTSRPQRSQVLTAWAGGSKAARFSGAAEDEIVDAALASLATIFGDTVPRDALQSVYRHDWQADPFARGAYSYVAVGGLAARSRLAAPLDETLFFAGEATQDDDEAGTVEGALRSGQRAARQAREARG